MQKLKRRDKHKEQKEYCDLRVTGGMGERITPFLF